MGKTGGTDCNNLYRRLSAVQAKLQLLKASFQPELQASKPERNGARDRVSLLPGQQTVVSGIVVILEVDNIQLRVVILTGLRKGTEIWLRVIKY